MILELALAPALVGAATLAGRRFGDRVAGVVSAFPAIVGPTLLITAREHGEAFARTAAEATLLGLASLAAFALVYGRVAGTRGQARCPARRGTPGLAPCPTAFLAAWGAAGAVGLALSGVETDSPAGLAVAVASLALAYVALPARPVTAAPRGGGDRVLVRMAATAVLVAALAAAAGAVGPVAGGVLAALPVLASGLAVATHRAEGPDAAVALLRGMLAGMGGFVAFCQVVALAATPAGFAGATAAAVLVQALVLYGARPTSATASWGVPSVWRRWTYASRASSRPSASSPSKYSG